MARRGDAWNLLHQRANGNKIAAPQLLRAILEDNYRLFADLAGEPWAASYEAPSVAIPMKGTGGLRQRLAIDALRLTDNEMMPGQDALTNIVEMASGIAAGAWREQPALRVARSDDGRIAFDLGRPDGAMVLLSPIGWELASRGALFRRGAGIGQLPDPVRGGAFPHLVNLKGRDQLALYTGCRVASMLPWGTRPIEMMTGQPGSAKTATMRTTVRWLGGFSTGMSRDPKEWVAQANNSHTLGHENVSGMSAERQDLFCKGASGHEHLSRMLYTNADLHVVRFQPISLVIEGVDLGMLRSDFIRRSVAHELFRPDAYLPESGFEAQWQRERAGALGWLCDVTCSVLDMLPRVQQPTGDSLADFAHVLAAIDAMWGTDALGLWRFDQEAMYAELAQGDPVALAVTKIITGPWEGSAGELLEVLKTDHALPGWSGPWTPRKLSAAMVRAQASLEVSKWKVIRVRDNHTKTYRYWIYPPGFYGR